MAIVTLRPMPHAYREIPNKFRPQHPTIFDGDPTPADIALARELFEALDPDSQEWYRGGSAFCDCGRGLFCCQGIFCRR